MYTTRLSAIQQALTDAALDGFVISHPANRRYLSGFTGTSGLLFITPSESYLVTDSRYYEQVEREAPDYHLWKQSGHMAEALAALVNSVSAQRLAFEAEAVTVAEHNRWRQALPEAEWQSKDELVARLREVKDAHEVERIRQATEIADRAFRRLVPLIQPGQTEREVAWQLEQLMREEGGEGPAFPTIVASGPNAALPHYRPGSRVIQPNEIVLIDFGATFEGYNSDCTRTLFTGDPSQNPEYSTLYHLVLDALNTAVEGIHAGVGAREADAMARDVIAGQGHGELFGHGLGHGLGVEVHEAPRINYRTPPEAQIPEGSIITIEPGIYRPGWGGIRIEQLAVVGQQGIEVLTGTSTAIDLWQRTQRAAGQVN